jgi:hypothetical protein
MITVLNDLHTNDVTKKVNVGASFMSATATPGTQQSFLGNLNLNVDASALKGTSKEKVIAALQSVIEAVKAL